MIKEEGLIFLLQGYYSLVPFIFPQIKSSIDISFKKRNNNISQNHNLLIMNILFGFGE